MYIHGMNIIYNYNVLYFHKNRNLYCLYINIVPNKISIPKYYVLHRLIKNNQLLIIISHYKLFSALSFAFSLF